MDIDGLAARSELHIRRANPALNTVLIEQHGQTLYSNVFDRNLSLHTPQQIRSVTKTVISMLIGIALQRGSIDDTQRPVVELLATRHGRLPSGQGIGQTTLHQLLSMTAGVPWRDGALGSEPMIGRIMRQSNWIDSILRLPTNASLIGQFQYNSALSHLLSAILTESTQTSTTDFAEKMLFGPLGIVDYTWEQDPQGIAIGGWGLSLTPMDLQKLGRLYLSDGVWQGQQVVPRSWIEQSTKAHSPQYGYQWWLMTLNGMQTWCAIGIGGQCICCVPELDAVIVTTSKPSGKRKILWPLFEEYWLPMIA